MFVLVLEFTLRDLLLRNIQEGRSNFSVIYFKLDRYDIIDDPMCQYRPNK